MATKLYVGNLPFSTNEEELRKVFAEAGEIVSVQIVTDKFTNKSRGFGFIEMATQEAANQAIQRFNGYTLDDRSLVVNEARPREDRRPGGGGGGGGGQRDRRPRSNFGNRDNDRNRY
ncbi:MAG: RNA-binding protein [Anaerolineae bacterium]|nr:RNA-binding protein [Anaerolineae bacterium]